MLKSQQPTVIPKIARYPTKRSYHFQPNPSNKCWISSPAVWNHPSDLIGFCPKQTAVIICFMLVVTTFPDSCDSFFMIVVTTFPDSWDNFFRTTMTAFSEQLWQLTQQLEHYWFFHIWLKPKPTIETTFLLLKYFHFLLLFPQQLSPETARIS